MRERIVSHGLQSADRMRSLHRDHDRPPAHRRHLCPDHRRTLQNDGHRHTRHVSSFGLTFRSLSVGILISAIAGISRDIDCDKGEEGVRDPVENPVLLAGEIIMLIITSIEMVVYCIGVVMLVAKR